MSVLEAKAAAIAAEASGDRTQIDPMLLAAVMEVVVQMISLLAKCSGPAEAARTARDPWFFRRWQLRRACKAACDARGLGTKADALADAVLAAGRDTTAAEMSWLFREVNPS